MNIAPTGNRRNAKRSRAKRKPKRKAVAKPYEQTPEEQVAIQAMAARIKELPVAPRVKVSKTGGMARFELDHPDDVVGHILLMEALGTTEMDFLNGLLKQLVNAGSQGKSVDESGLNFMLAVVKGVEPQDQVEAMLAAPIYKITTLLWLHSHGGTDFEVCDDVSPTGKLGGLAMTGRVRNWARLVKGKPSFDGQAKPVPEFTPNDVDLIARAVGRVSDAAGFDSPAPGNARTATTRPSGSPGCPQKVEGVSTRVSAAQRPKAA